MEAEIVEEGNGPPPSKPLAEEAVKPFEESEADYQERVDVFLQQCRVIEQTRARLWTSWDTQRAPMVVYIIEKMSDSELAHLKELASSSLESYPDSLQNRLNTDREEILKQFAMQHQYKWLLVGTPNNPNEHIVVQEGEFNDMNELSENRKHPPSHLRRGKMYSLTKIDEKWRYGHLIQSTVEDQ